ncbi:MAG: polysaccharide deacetylase family protein [Phycisphaerae bacterium]|nr:polysaccharide deacetylase family protein [Phycisphaerae bacterium]
MLKSRNVAWVVSVGISLVSGWGCSTVLDPNTTDPNQFDPSAFYVNIQVDAELQEGEGYLTGLKRMTDELESRGINATIYVSADFASAHAAEVHGLYGKGFEIALHGYSTGEQLATMTYDDQKDVLCRALAAVKGCAACGVGQPVVGFRPQYFSQNADTCKILDELEFEYNSGYKVGVQDADGFTPQADPVPADGRSFNVLAITTTSHEEELIYLCDISCAMAHQFTPEQFGELLSAAVQECRQNGRPLVALFHGWYTGDSDTYDYWTKFTAFLDELEALENISFVTSRQLVDLYEGDD